jgi:polyhydroxybutyrate depolymerase
MTHFYALVFLFLFTLSATNAHAQAINTAGTIQHDGLTREYRLYVPALYNPAQPTPLLLNLHGYTSNNAQQQVYGNFTSIADTANIILIHPNGTFDANGDRFWNAGFSASGPDDVGFLLALIDTISAQYNIDPARIYTTGMSNGGYMSYELACQTNRFAAMASVTGTMVTQAFNNCSPTRPIPVMGDTRHRRLNGFIQR